MTEALVVIYEASNAAMSYAVKSALEEVGFPVIEQVERVTNSADLSGPGRRHGRYSRLLTFESRAKEAKTVVQEFLAILESGKFDPSSGLG